MTRWLRYSKTICNLVLQSKNPLFLHKPELFSMFELAKQLYLLPCPAWPGQNPCSWWMLSGQPLRIRRGKSHYSAYLLTPFQNDTNLLRTPFSLVSAASFKQDSHGTFTPHTVPALSSYYHLHCFLLSVRLRTIGTDSVFQDCGPAGFWWELRVIHFSLRLQAHHTFEPLLGADNEVQFTLAGHTKQSRADAKRSRYVGFEKQGSVVLADISLWRKNEEPRLSTKKPTTLRKPMYVRGCCRKKN